MRNWGTEKLRRQHEGEQNGTIGGTSMILVTPTSKHLPQNEGNAFLKVKY